MGIAFGRTGISAEKGLSPAFETIVQRTNGIEIRRYPSFLVAEVQTETDKTGLEGDRDVRSKAFNTLARYIGVFGSAENETAGKISMTAPVLMESQSEKISMTSPVISETGGSPSSRSMSFIMPSKYKSLDDLPKPKDSRVQLKEVPSTVVLCMTWYGRVNDGGISKLSECIELCLKDKLLKLLIDEDIMKNKWRLASYNPPFTLPPFQKHEIHIPVTDKSEEEIKSLVENEPHD